jgi:hypothetical protein
MPAIVVALYVSPDVPATISSHRGSGTLGFLGEKSLSIDSAAAPWLRKNVFKEDISLTRRKQCVTPQAAIFGFTHVTSSRNGDDLILRLATWAYEGERL